jgi:hypothetical protein
LQQASKANIQSMELSVSSTSPALLKLNHHFLSKNSLPIKIPSLHFANDKKLPSFYRQTKRPSFLRKFASPASSSIAVGPSNDRLPADIKVTETPEPNSRVSTSLSLFHGKTIMRNSSHLF